MSDPLVIPRPPLPEHPAEGAPVDAAAASFFWKPVPHVQRYRLQIAADPACEAVQWEVDAGHTTALTLYRLLPDDGTTWYWRVGTDDGAWSPAQPFKATTDDEAAAYRAAQREAATARARAARRAEEATPDAGPAPYLTEHPTTRGQALALAGLLVFNLLVMTAILWLGMA